ncbi:MAG TPA: DUF664 domain-containing protein [Mycobacteriales bacterium]|nr:DUF664 domain-containing protein [Mycobacteriales bacterium]
MLTLARAELAAQRRHVEHILAGLPDAALRTPQPPTTWPPAAVVHHLALDVERWWFGAVVTGDAAVLRYFDEHPGGAWSVPPGTDVFEVYRREQAAADRILDSVPWDAEPVWWPDFLGPRQNVGQILLHVVTETATHAGQLDIVREAIDGTKWLVLDE